MAFLLALENGMPHLNALFFASFGNVLAITLNYFLGYYLYDRTKTKLNSSKVGRKSLFYGDKYGFIALFFSWIPIVGDPLTFVAGLLRINFSLFIVIAGVLRIGRYYVLTFVI